MIQLLLAALFFCDVTAGDGFDPNIVARLSLYKIPASERPPLDPGIIALAKESYRSGEDAYTHSEWRAAFHYFQRAFRFSSDPTLWFNMGLALRHFAPEDAYWFLLEFLNSPAEIPDRPAVIRLITRVRDEADATKIGRR